VGVPNFAAEWCAGPSSWKTCASFLARIRGVSTRPTNATSDHENRKQRRATPVEDRPDKPTNMKHAGVRPYLVRKRHADPP